jgi:hypothetical protein
LQLYVVLLIYTNHTTTRLQYIVNTLFGNEGIVTDSLETFLQYEGAKINYSPQRFGDDLLWIRPYGLLSEEGITQQYTECFEWKGWKVFFKTMGDIPFDIFSASFYLVSRYEEYLIHKVDEYERYAYTNSLAYKENFLHLPLVNLWLKELEKMLQQKYNSPPISGSNFTFLPTYDIDIAYSYLHQPLWLNVFGFYRDLLKADFDKVIERGNVYSGRTKDPFDVYDHLDELHDRFQLHPVYFFLMAAKRKGVDKNLSSRSRGMSGLIKRHAVKYAIGIHPSWQSGSVETRQNPVENNDESEVEWLVNALLEKEIRSLNEITGNKTLSSRQHYIRMNLPGTYRLLIEMGITSEYSMGYGNINGFRASFSLPFYWYDLPKEELTGLRIYPFCYMEATSYFEQKYSAEQAAAELQQYHDVVKQVNGQLITIFHNHFLTLQPQWLPWRKMYEQFLEKNFS